MKTIITIGRQYGSGGREIGKKVAEKLGVPTAAIELEDGTIITSKTTELLGASSALLLNALKYLGGINEDLHLIAPNAFEPIQNLKTRYLGSKNPRLASGSFA